MNAVQVYRRARQDFFEQHGHLWADTLYDAFDILEPFCLSSTEVREILQTTAGVAQIYAKASELIRRASDDALQQMGVPSHLLRIVRCTIPGMPDCVVGRLDLAPTDGGYKLLEFNADVAALVVEAFSINRAICRHVQKLDPNEKCEAILRETLCTAVRSG